MFWEGVSHVPTVTFLHSMQRLTATAFVNGRNDAHFDTLKIHASPYKSPTISGFFLRNVLDYGPRALAPVADAGL